MADWTDWAHRRNLLCFRPDNLGDVLMTTPALRALRAHVPGRRLTLLASRRGAGVAALIPEIDEVMTFDVPWVRTRGGAAGSRATLELVERLRQRGFDGAVIFTVFSQNPLPSALVCYLAGIPASLGYCRESPYGLLTHWVPDDDLLGGGIIHEVERQLNLVRCVGATPAGTRLSLRVPRQSAARVARTLVALGVSPRRFLVVHPGASEARRRCPPAVLAEAVRQLAAQGHTLVLTGTAGEAALCQRLLAAAGGQAVSLAGKLALDELAALLQMAAGLIANNTGPAHMAAAVGTPVTVLYALTNPQHTPWQVPHRVLYFDVPPDQRSRSPLLQATYRAMRAAVPEAGLTPARIVAAANELLAEHSAPPPEAES